MSRDVWDSSSHKLQRLKFCRFQYYQSIEQTGKATVLRIFELIDYKSLSISTKYQHLNSYENIFSSLVHIMDEWHCSCFKVVQTYFKYTFLTIYMDGEQEQPNLIWHSFNWKKFLSVRPGYSLWLHLTP